MKLCNLPLEMLVFCTKNFWRSRTVIIVGISILSTASAIAQHALYAEHDGKMFLVRRARGTAAMVEENNHSVTANGRNFFLSKIDEFLPVFVTVHELSVRRVQARLIGGDVSSDINHAFEFKAEFSSTYTLPNVFVVLEFDFKDKTKPLLLQEVGQLKPHQPRSISLSFPIGYELGEGQYRIHLFSNGIEVLHSKQSQAYREQMLDHIIANRIKQLKDGDPQPLFGPQAEYPAKLAKTKIKGHATVTFRVNTHGAVLDPVATSASDPAFGEAAVAALRLWRFLPRMKAGIPVETTVNLPVAFDPPEKS